MPEGVNVNGRITTDLKCPDCDEPVVIADGFHYIENYELLTRLKQ
jgi:hypothetical protein